MMIFPQKGQALVESIIGISFVAVPLLTLMPFLSKVSSLQHTAAQASQYSAWERTVWKNESPDLLPVQGGVYLAKRTESELSDQLPQRFYSKNQIRLSSEIKDWNWKKDLKPFAKHQYKRNSLGESLIKLDNRQDNHQQTRTYNPLDHKNSGSETPGKITGAISKVLGMLKFTGFSLEDNQFYRTDVSTDLENLYFEEFEALNLTVSGQSALLASGWNASGFEHSRRRIEKLVPAKLLDIGVIKKAQKIIGVIPFAKDLKSNSLKFGYVDPYKLPKNKLCRFGTNGCGE